MRISIITRRPFTVIGAVAIAALTVLIMAPRPMFRPAPHPVPLFPRGPAQPQPQPAVRLPAAAFRAARSPATFNSSFSTSTAFGQSNFNSSATINGNSRNFSFMSSTPFGSLNFNRTATLSGSLNTALTLSRSISLSEMINGRTASFSASNSVTLTAAQIAADIIAHRVRHAERVQLRQAQLAAGLQGYGFPMTMYPYSAASYGGGGYGGMGYPSSYGGMGYGGGAQQQAAAPAAPGVQVGGNEAEREERPVDHMLASLGVTGEDGKMLWPIGLRALPGDRDGRLRGEIEALLTREKEAAAAGGETANLARDLTAAVDALRAQLLRDKQERFSLTFQAYDDAGDYLAKLKQAAKLLGESGTRELRSGKPEAREVSEVALMDNRFEPPTLTVRPGTTVRWTNRGKHTHTVTSDKGDWGSNEMGPAAVFSHTFTKAGTYTYHCEVHPEQMRGTVVVK
jgi:plastocyanin